MRLNLVVRCWDGLSAPAPQRHRRRHGFRRIETAPALILATMLLALVIPGCGSSERQPAAGVADIAQGGPIAFASDKDGTESIYTINPDGSDLKRLTDGPGQDSTPVFSPDGKKIAFYRAEASGTAQPVASPQKLYDIVVMNADGSRLQRLTPFAAPDASGIVIGAPSTLPVIWSPDGKMIAFLCYRAYDRNAARIPDQICLMNADATNLHPLLPNNAGAQYVRGDNPIWIDGGKAIAFVDSNPEGGIPPTYGISAINPDGTHLRQLRERVGQYVSIAASPDGKRIAYGVSDTEIVQQQSVWTMNADGSDARKLDIGNWLLGDRLVWSPDGSEIALDAASSPPNSTSILVVKADGSGYKVVPKLPRVLVPGFVWSPDGKQLAFTLSLPSGTPGADSSNDIRSIQTVYVDGSDRRAVTTEAWFADHGDVLAEPSISWGSGK